MINRFDSVRKFASHIVSSRKLTPPIDPTEIIHSYGIKLIEEKNQWGIEAYSDLGDIPTITINTEFTFPARKKFTLAHELGHVIIPWHNGDTKCDTDNPCAIIDGKYLLDTQELEANIFASELLMPHEWLHREITHADCSFQEMIHHLQNSAQTSVMACLYALEYALPAGKLFYVKKDNTDYWKKFNCGRACTIELYSKIADRFNFLAAISNRYEYFHFSQYDILFFDLFPCPEKKSIQDTYLHSSNIGECINILSAEQPSKVLLYLKEILCCIDDIFSCFVFVDGIHIRTVMHPHSKVKMYSTGFEDFLHVLEYNSMDFCIVEDNSHQMVFVKDCNYEMPIVEPTEPNALLKQIVNEIYPDCYANMLARINGIMSNASIRINDPNQIFEKVKSRFSTASDFIEFYNHPSFNTYVVNKIKSILKARS